MADLMRWDVLAAIINRRGYRFGVEIGCGKGLNALNLMRLCPNLNLIGVDYWPPDYAGGDGEPRTARKQAKLEARYRRVLHKHSDRMRLIRKPSVAASTEIGPQVDFVFIDGDHSYEGCKADIEAWAPKVRKGGLIAGHDHSDDYPGVVEAVAEAFGVRAEMAADDVWLVQT